MGYFQVAYYYRVIILGIFKSGMTGVVIWGIFKSLTTLES